MYQTKSARGHYLLGEGFQFPVICAFVRVVVSLCAFELLRQLRDVILQLLHRELVLRVQVLEAQV